MTFGGGVGAAFDGGTSQPASACARSEGVQSAYVGLFWVGLAKKIKGIRIIGSSDHGIYEGADPVITVNVRGDEGDNGPDGGSLLASFSFIDEPGVDKTLITGFALEFHLWHWIEIVHNEAIAPLNVAEGIFYE